MEFATRVGSIVGTVNYNNKESFNIKLHVKRFYLVPSAR